MTSIVPSPIAVVADTPDRVAGRSRTSALDEQQQSWLVQLTADLDAGALLYVSGYAAGLAAARHQAARNDVASARAVAEAVQDSPSLRATVLYASHTGNGRRIAERLSQVLEARGVAVRCVNAGDYSTRELGAERLLLLVASTHGDGDPPDEARGFYDFLLGRKAPRLPELRYAVLALGDSSYPKFCETGRVIDERLSALGATSLAPRVDCDVDFGAASDRWIEAAIEQAIEIAKPTGPRLSIVAAHRTEPPRVAVATREQPIVSAIVAQQRITGRHSDHPVTHFEIAAPADSLDYQPGDSLGVWHENPGFLAEQVAEVLGLDLARDVECDGYTRTLAEWLVRHRELTRLSRPVLKAQADRGGHAELLALAAGSDSNARSTILRDWQLIDLLARYPAAWSAQEFVSALRPLAPRLYSIASSREEVGDEAHLTVASVDYRRDGARRVGAASHFLAATDSIAPHDRGETDAARKLRVFLEPNPRFRLPADGARELIMVGAGTGIAPFRGFLQARVAAGARGRHWLVFGARRLGADFLYQSEWLAARKRGTLHRLDVAFSRDQPEKVYVQHRLRAQGAELWRWLENGACLYVCGDAARMAPDVHAALAEIVEKHGGRTPEQAREYLSELTSARRYLRDVY